MEKEGCYQSIKEDLGYRLVASTLDFTLNKTFLSVSLLITNKGYAPPYIKSDINFILKNNNHTYQFKQKIDIRTFYPQKVNTVMAKIPLSDMAKGEYCLYLQIGKGYSSIRLSNNNIWDNTILANRLVCGIVIP